MSSTYTQELDNWIKKEKTAIVIGQLIDNLNLDKAVEIVLFRKQLVNIPITDVIDLHLQGSKIAGVELKLDDCLLLLQEISMADLAPARIDIGRLLREWDAEKGNYGNAKSFVASKLADCIEQDNDRITPKDVILYGFGRIGRLLARELIYQGGKGNQLRLKAIVTRENTDLSIKKRAELLRTDSIHGKFKGTIIEDYANKRLIVNGFSIEMIAAKDPDAIDYTQYGIENALLIDNTGVFRDRAELGRHLVSKGVDKVLLTAPAKDIPNIVYGVNHNEQDLVNEKIFSAASCTTNAIVPVLKIINDTFGMETGHIETVHSFTNDQNLLDNYHKKSRRGRAATLNMVITETGAGSAVAKALPELIGKITGNSIRVPTPDASVAVLNLYLNREVTRDEINESLRLASLSGNLVEQIEFSTNDELVSSDIIGNNHSSIVDGPATIIMSNNKGIVLYVWYDNEYGYSRQVIRLSKVLSNVVRFTYY